MWLLSSVIIKSSNWKPPLSGANFWRILTALIAFAIEGPLKCDSLDVWRNFLTLNSNHEYKVIHAFLFIMYFTIILGIDILIIKFRYVLLIIGYLLNRWINIPFLTRGSYLKSYNWILTKILQIWAWVLTSNSEYLIT